MIQLVLHNNYYFCDIKMIDGFLIFLIVAIVVLVIALFFNSFYEKKYKCYVMLFLFLLLISFIGLAIGWGLYIDGSMPLYFYKVTNSSEDIFYQLKDSDQCAYWSCRGTCTSYSSTGSSASCFTDMNVQGYTTCTSTCDYYIKKYDAYKSYTLRNVKNPEKQITAYIHTKAVYDSEVIAKQFVFSNIIGVSGYLEDITDFNTDIAIQWIIPSEHEKKKSDGLIVSCVFGGFGIVVILVLIVILLLKLCYYLF